MKKLILFLFVLPLLSVGQNFIINSNKLDSVRTATFILVDEDKALHGSCEPITPLDVQSVLTPNYLWPETKIERNIIITDKTIKEYIDWCNKDSILTWKLEEAYYTYPDKIGVNVNLIFHPAEYVQKWKRREPTFIGFYKWLKDKNKDND